MKATFNRVVPILLGVGLWSCGNVLMTKAVKGQEVPGVPSCTNVTVTDAQTDCQKDCTGMWTRANHNESDCQGSDGDPQHPCMSGYGPSTAFFFSGTCHPKVVTTPIGNTYRECRTCIGKYFRL
jgi:hypothetical protein